MVLHQIVCRGNLYLLENVLPFLDRELGDFELSEMLNALTLPKDYQQARTCLDLALGINNQMVWSLRNGIEMGHVLHIVVKWFSFAVQII